MKSSHLFAFLVSGVIAARALAGEAPASGEAFVRTRQTLTLVAARAVIGACEAEARSRGVGVVVAVVDEGGHVLQVSRMDSVQVASVEVGIGKARTAAIFRRPSRIFEEQIATGRVAALALPGATPLQGGVPIAIDGVVVGAVGVSGDSPQVDEEIAIAGANALRPAAAALVGR